VPSTAEILDILFREFGIEHVIVPPDFSLKFADGIRQYGYTVEVKVEPFFESRVAKTPEETDLIKDTIRATEDAIRAGIELIRKADIEPSGRLMLNARPLTSVDVRREMHTVLTHHDCYATHTVISCGAETVSPHEEGRGVLYANQPILIDCSPKSLVNGYFADLTRTVVRGHAPEPLKRQFDTVRSAQEYAISLLKPGANGREIHAAVTRFFDDLGYKTHAVNGKPQGFFHATGHGIGIEGHERPHLALRDHLLETGNVLAVEPALYYDGIGGIRIEDDVLVKEDGVLVLSELECVLEI
jgi:Xaa-Pro aminopeptidase